MRGMPLLADDDDDEWLRYIAAAVQDGAWQDDGDAEAEHVVDRGAVPT